MLKVLKKSSEIGLDKVQTEAIQSDRTRLDVLESRLSTAMGQEKQVMLEMLAFIKSQERRIARLEKNLMSD